MRRERGGKERLSFVWNLLKRCRKERILVGPTSETFPPTYGQKAWESQGLCLKCPKYPNFYYLFFTNILFLFKGTYVNYYIQAFLSSNFLIHFLLYQTTKSILSLSTLFLSLNNLSFLILSFHFLYASKQSLMNSIHFKFLYSHSFFFYQIIIAIAEWLNI